MPRVVSRAAGLSFIVGCLLASVHLMGQTATFVKLDTTTQGNWKSQYGIDGYNVIGDTVSYPAYAAVTASGQSLYTWSTSTPDIRALQKASSIDRLAAIWYSGTTFSVDVNLTDGFTHQVAVYCTDWDNNGPRSQTVSILNSTTQAVLDSRTLSTFQNGQYLVWNLSGHITIRITRTGGANGVLNGIFFGSSGPVASATAQFLTMDTTTQGNWQQAYGLDGYNIIGNATSYPAYATVAAAGQALYTWASSTTDVRALQKVNANDRIAATWDSGTHFTVNTNTTDGEVHQLAAYCLDWDNQGRAERVEIVDTQTGVILDSRSVSAFTNGLYLSWNVSGNVTINVNHVSGINAVVSGIFFGVAAPSISNLSPSSGPVGSAVTITGRNFGAAQGTSTVSFNGTAATPSSWSSTSLTVPVPTGATTGPLVVTVNGVASNGLTFTVLPIPNITSLAPTSGFVGSSVTITGTNFGATQASSTVTFNGTVATPTTWSDASVSAPVPTGAITGPVMISNNGVGSNGVVFTVLTAPHIASLTPTWGAVGASVTISGVNFGATQGTSTVTFNGTAGSPSSWGDTSIIVPVPTGATTGNVVVTVGGQSSSGVNFVVNSAPIAYAYDELNRLVGVADASGETATYSYDAAGNITAISRTSPGQVSVIALAPSKGAIGSPVTITGTGFSSTPSQNTVAFNGTPATVTNSNATQILTSVPSGATTGLVNVTSPTGSATSTSPFTVITSANTPTVSGFSPAIALPGTAIAITGTNFDPTPSKDFAQFNTTYSPVSSAAANGTSITASIPSKATSGPVGVTTSGGQALSTGDLFVPPSPYQPTDIGFTGRMNLGGSGTITIPSANQIGMMLFDGTTGHRVTMNITSSNLACHSVLSLIGPGNISPGASGSISICGSSLLVQPVSFSNTGTYTLVIPPQTAAGASVSLALYDTPPDITNLIAIDGAAQTYSLTVGQDIRLPFVATAGQRVVGYITAVSYPQANFNLLNPDGSQHAYMGISNSGYPNNQFFLDTQTLNTAGTYTLWVAHTALDTGSVTLKLNSVPPDISGPIQIDGSAVTVGPTAVGQDARLYFTTTGTNQRVVVYVTAVSTPSTNIDLLNPDGTQHAYMGVNNSGYPNNLFFMDTQTLSNVGTYAVQVRHNGTNVGSETVQVKSVPADISGSLTINGASQPFTTVVGQNASFTFNNPQTQTVSIHWASDTYASCNLYVNGPSPATNQVGYSGCQTGTSSLSLTNLASGTYTILVNPPSTTTGGMTLSVTSP